jgi:transposase
MRPRGRPSIAPEKLLRASLLQAFFSVRSERQLMEQLDYNLLFRWFVGLGVDDPVWDATVFTKNRDRLLDAEVAGKFMAAVLAHREIKPLLSSDHFSVDGTLIEAWASLKSFRAKDGSDEPPSPGRNGERRFKGEKRRNDTHESTTDPEAKLYRKSSSAAAKLSYIGHALAENRHGLIVQADATKATSRAEREAALAMIERQDPGSERRLTLGADKGYDTAGFVAECRRMCVTPHVAAKVKQSAVDSRTTRHASYAISQRKRKLVEEAFGWAKTIAGMEKVKVRGLARVRHSFTLAMTAYNLIRMPKLLGWGAA